MKHRSNPSERKLFRIGTLAILLGLTPISQAESDLFKQAVFAEETEGDLAKAIGLYQKVVDSNADQDGKSQEWASALLQLAKCQAKLGQTEEARQAAQKIVAKFENEKELAQEAQDFLATLETPKTYQVSVHDVDSSDEATLLDFETGQVWSFGFFPAEIREDPAQLEKKGVDLVIEFIGEKKGLGVFGSLAQVDPLNWNEIPNAEKIDQLLVESAREQAPIEVEEGVKFFIISDNAEQLFGGDKNAPLTYVFRNRNQTSGVLQIVSIDEEKELMELQYRLVPRTLRGQALKKHVVGRWISGERGNGMTFKSDGSFFEDEGTPDVTDDHGSYRVEGETLILQVPDRPEARATVTLDGAVTVFTLKSQGKEKVIRGTKTPFLLTTEQKMKRVQAKSPTLMGIVQTLYRVIEKNDKAATIRNIDAFLQEVRPCIELFQDTDLEGMVEPMVKQLESMRKAVQAERWDEVQQTWTAITASGPIMETLFKKELEKQSK